VKAVFPEKNPGKLLVRYLSKYQKVYGQVLTLLQKIFLSGLAYPAYSVLICQSEPVELRSAETGSVCPDYFGKEIRFETTDSP